jgi:hypothetical protein
MDHPEIPKGFYCYSIESIEHGPKTEATAAMSVAFGFEDEGEIRMKTKPCPHWKCDPNLPQQESGICTFLNISDREHHTLLWDQVKECGLNLGDNEDDLNTVG